VCQASQTPAFDLHFTVGAGLYRRIITKTERAYFVCSFSIGHLELTSKDAAYRPRAVDYSTNASWATGSEHTGRLSSKRIRANRTSASAARVTGATRRSELPEPLSLPLGKISAALMFAAGGILVATSSTGTVSPAPELNTLTAALLPPDFFFADEDSAVDARALRHELNHSEPLIPPKKDSEDSSGLPRAHQVQAAMASILSDPKLNQEAQDQATTITSSTELPLPVTEVENTVQTPVATIAQEQEPVLTQKAPEAVQLVDETASTIAEVTVQTGDTLSGLLNDNGLKGNELAQLLEHKLVKDELSRLNVGQTFSIERDASGKLLSLISRASPDRRITIIRDDSGFKVAAADLPVEKERVVTSGTIQQSLYLAAEEADLKQSTIMELADIFQWELDFARDIRKGDHFSIVYDRLYREGEYIGDGDILAAEFVRGGRNYQAIRFTTDDGKSAYYTPNGESKRRTFLRHPVDVVRITSRFDQSIKLWCLWPNRDSQAWPQYQYPVRSHVSYRRQIHCWQESLAG